LSASQPAVFLDRDGVLNRVVVRDGVPHPPDDTADFELLPGVPAALDRLVRAGFLLVVVTNQPDVARGTKRREEVEELNERVRAMLPITAVFTCFHDDDDGCECRKPRPGLLTEAARRWSLDLQGSFMVGDRWTDVLAGQAAGGRAVLVDTSYGGAGRCVPDHRVANLMEAVDWILRTTSRGEA